jgi:ribosomal protein S27E
MPCPTCGNKLDAVFINQHRSAFHCDRCGTKVTKGGGGQVVVPTLVSRCRALAAIVEPGGLGDDVSALIGGDGLNPAKVCREWLEQLGIPSMIRDPKEPA